MENNGNMFMMRGVDIIEYAKKQIIKAGKKIVGKFEFEGVKYNSFGPIYNGTVVCEREDDYNNNTTDTLFLLEEEFDEYKFKRYANWDYNSINSGGSKKRKTSKRKTSKRKTSKRKTSKRKTSKRKTKN